MPLYQYECQECEWLTEVLHSMSESPAIECEKCGGKTVRIVSLFSSVIKGPAQKSDKAKNDDMMADLKENHGIHTVTPISPKDSVESVYNYIKSTGGYAKEEMIKKKEMDEKKNTEKRREWKKAALKRTPARAQVMKEQRAKEKQERGG